MGLTLVFFEIARTSSTRIIASGQSCGQTTAEGVNIVVASRHIVRLAKDVPEASAVTSKKAMGSRNHRDITWYNQESMGNILRNNKGYTRKKAESHVWKISKIFTAIIRYDFSQRKSPDAIFDDTNINVIGTQPHYPVTLHSFFLAGKIRELNLEDFLENLQMIKVDFRASHA